MSIASAARLRNEMCFCIICIDSHENGDIAGRIFNAYYRDAIFFENGLDLLGKMEDIFDIFGYPHRTMDVRRSFSKYVDDPDEDDKGASVEKAYEKAGRKTAGEIEDKSDPAVSSNIVKIGNWGAAEEVKPEPAAQPKKGTSHERIHIAPSTRLVKHNAVGKLATLRTRVMFRQNAEWQGNAKWLEADLTENFSSVLELIMLIDSLWE